MVINILSIADVSIAAIQLLEESYVIDILGCGPFWHGGGVQNVHGKMENAHLQRSVVFDTEATPWLLWLESPHRAPLVGAAGVHPEVLGGVVCLRLKPSCRCNSLVARCSAPRAGPVMSPSSKIPCWNTARRPGTGTP